MQRVGGAQDRAEDLLGEAEPGVFWGLDVEEEDKGFEFEAAGVEGLGAVGEGM